ncbi:putative flavanone 3-dioxygenase [Helianthus annuus]|nr:protein DMR6-LIKE OXYGENASE 2 [Helianthus annuus]KAJ0602394.1 putative flavanone 3-dioxygenase [Helianthus annuus]KAJ0937186.1 putative flavanone 3-dioxygenase [Helianthus annuus]
MATTSKPLLLSDMVASGEMNQVPSKYIHPITERPNYQNVVPDSIPVIDLQNLNGPNRSQVLDEIRRACSDNGFFQVKNHGIPESIIANMMQMAREFFNLPLQERLKMYSDDPTKANRLSTSYNVRTEKISHWRDYLGLHCYPLQDYIHQWPTNPESFRDIAAEYCRSVRVLALQLVEAISESLGLDKDYISAQLGSHAQVMALNYYPPCPQPDLTYGLPGHTDGYVLTLLLQDEVSGLQLLKDGQWVAVDPVPNAFVINIGDQIQVISNDKYKSAMHRAVVNSEKERISIPTFYCPSPDAVIGPAPQLVTDDEPAVYRQFTFEEYNRTIWTGGLHECLDAFHAT